MKHFFIAGFLLFGSTFAADPEISNLVVEVDSFRILKQNPSAGQSVLIEWEGSLTFDANDQDGDTLYVSVYVIIGADTLLVDSLWGDEVVLSGIGFRTGFIFQYTHQEWSDSVDAKIMLSVADNPGVVWEYVSHTGYNLQKGEFFYLQVFGDSLRVIRYLGDFAFCQSGTWPLSILEGDTVDAWGGSSMAYKIANDTLTHFFFEDGDTANPEITWYKKSAFTSFDQTMAAKGDCHNGVINCATGTISDDYFNDLNGVGILDVYIWDDRDSILPGATGGSYTFGFRDCDTLVFFSSISTATQDTFALYESSWLNAGSDSILVIRSHRNTETNRDTIVLN